ncbi:MAG: 3-isopropylmalate dehydratase small subunit [Anaerolineae bacterium]|nr:MAG: 3-isopropylmalate dehydratase small subunit [Anaerolineae bacterium]
MAKVVLTLGDDISTDHIYPGRYMATVLPTETPQYAFADYPLNKKLNSGQIAPQSIIVAGENFGCGSSREQAVSALKGWELVIIARSFARIFFQNAINLGLRVVICPQIEANEGDELEITECELINHTSGRRFAILPLPPARQAIIEAGGLIAYTRKRLLEERQA